MRCPHCDFQFTTLINVGVRTPLLMPGMCMQCEELFLLIDQKAAVKFDDEQMALLKSSEHWAGFVAVQENLRKRKLAARGFCN